MSILEEFGDFFKTLRVYLMGRGVLSLMVMGSFMAATAIWGAGSMMLPALVIATGGLALSAGVRLYSQRLYEDGMVDLYREDVAKHLGIDPQEVTRGDLKRAAEENDVIAQALARQRRINWVSFATSALAAAATFGMLYMGLAGEVSKSITEFFSHFDSAATVARYASVGLVSGISGLILHNGLEEVIGYGSGLSKAAAHDLIVEMERDVRRGKTITPEQVYAVIVAENPAIQARIKQEFKEPYESMNIREQREVLATYGLKTDMEEIAGFINRHEVRPGRLAYMMHYAQPKRTSSSEIAITPTSEIARGSFVERYANTREQRAPGYQERLLTERHRANNAEPSLS